jgi:hypothetical protein
MVSWGIYADYIEWITNCFYCSPAECTISYVLEKFICSTTCKRRQAGLWQTQLNLPLVRYLPGSEGMVEISWDWEILTVLLA